MTGRKVRIFISSPGDVGPERIKARQVITQLQHWYGRERVELEDVLWERLPLQPSASFQQGIEAVLSESDGVDIAVFILWSRLGSPLGPSIVRADGSEYRSGTEREFEVMLAAHESSGGARPSVLAYVRSDDRAFQQRLVGIDVEQARENLTQRELVDRFLGAHFRDGQGHNRRAFHSYDVPVSFARRLTVHLRAVLDKLLEDNVPREARWTKPPYRGLARFDIEDSPIFFGREQETCDLEEAVRRREREEGLAFVCVVGASGAGKSSLVRAGLAANLTRYNLDDAIEQWRAAFVLPREADGDVAARAGLALAQVLPELPELRASSFAQLLSRSPAQAIEEVLRPVMHKLEGTRVLLVVDQLEELFTTASIGSAGRATTWAALEALARSGLVWVVATLRSDFYALAQAEQGFLRLKGASGHFDLVAPSKEGLAALISQPAALVGVRFEKAAEKSLEARILFDAGEQPDALPLVEYLLTELHARRTPDGLLTSEAYEALGGVAGAIGTRAEAVYQGLDVTTRNALAIVLRRLATVSEDGVVTSRSAPLAAFPPDSAERRLLTAFIDARLVMAEGDEVASRVRVTHEALLKRWSLAHQLIEADRERLIARGRLEEAFKRWDAAKRPVDLLLPEGLPLVEAESLVRAWTTVLESEWVSFIAASRARAMRRRRTVRAVVAVTTVVLAALTVWALLSAERARASEKDAATKLAEAQTEQSRFLADQARRAESPRIATLLALEALPVDGERPLVREALEALPAVEARLPSVSFRHDGAVLSAVFSADGTRVVTHSWDKTAGVWDAATGKRLATFHHEKTVRSAVFSTDGTHVVTASDDGTAGLWDAATGTRLATLRHEGTVWSAVFSADGARVVTASEDKTGGVWDAATGKRLATLRHDGPVLSAVFDADRRRVVTASVDNTACVWDALTGRRLATLRHEDTVRTAIFSADGRSVATASMDMTAGLWDAATARRLVTIRHKAWVVSVGLSADGLRVLTASSDRTAGLWDASTGRQLATLRHESGVNSAVFSADGKRIVTASVDTTAGVWDAATGIRLATLRHGDTVHNAGFSVDGARVVTASKDNTAWVWDAATGKRLATLQHEDTVQSAVFSPDGTRVVTASEDGAVVWDATTGKRLATLRHEDTVWSAVFGPDGTRVVTASEDGTAVVWDATTGKRLATFGHEDGVKSAVFSADGTRVVTASRDNTAGVWDAATGKRLATLRHEGSVTSAMFSGDGRRVVTAAFKTAWVWDVTSGRLVTKHRHEALVLSVAFSADGLRATSGSMDATAVVWDATTGRRLATLRHNGPVQGAVFNADGTRVVTASWDSSAAVWDSATGVRLATFGHEDGAVFNADGAVFNADGARVATASWDKSVAVWDSATGTRLATFPHEQAVDLVVFSTDGDRVVTVVRGNTAAVWAVPSIAPRTSSVASSIRAVRERVRQFGWCLTDAEREQYFLSLMPAERRAAECGSGAAERATVESDAGVSE